jgi:hypothetical protein
MNANPVHLGGVPGSIAPCPATRLRHDELSGGAQGTACASAPTTGREVGHGTLRDPLQAQAPPGDPAHCVTIRMWVFEGASQWIIVINRTTAPYYPVLFQGCDVSITDVGFSISIKITDTSSPDTASIAEITGTFSKPWRDPKHEAAAVKVIGVGGKTASGTGNITGSDSSGEPAEILISVRGSNAEQEGKDYTITVKRLDYDH